MYTSLIVFPHTLEPCIKLSFYYQWGRMVLYSKTDSESERETAVLCASIGTISLDPVSLLSTRNTAKITL